MKRKTNMTEQKTWNEQLKEWIENNPDKLKLLKDRLGKKSVRDYKSSRIAILEKLSPDKRNGLYEITGLDVFRLGGVAPNSISLNAIMAGKQPRTYLTFWLRNKGISLSDFSKNCGIAMDTLNKYLDRKSIRPDAKIRIIKKLKEYASKETGDIMTGAWGDSIASIVEEAEIPTDESDLIRKFADVSSNIEALRNELTKACTNDKGVKLLRERYAPSVDVRIKTIDTALQVIGEELDYFRQAPSEERAALVEGTDPDLFGYIVNVLGGMHQKQSWETVLRLYPPPNRIRSKKK